MQNRIGLGLAAATLTLLALAGCSASGTGGYGQPADTPTTTPAPAPTAGDAALSTADSSLGTIVVDGAGMTVYVFDNDTVGATSSACSGDCAANWPAVPAGAGDPQLDGVTGEVGTITGVDGEPQLTLGGLPLYYFAGDNAAGDVNGQGVGGIWWVVGPDGAKISG